MSVTTTDLLTAAHKIFTTGTCEADWRNTCSRSYYAIYHDLKAFADSLTAAAYRGNIAGAKPGMHHQLYTGLKNPTVPASDPRRKLSFKLGVMAQSLHSARVKADYHPDQSIDQVEANVNLTAAQNIPALIAGQPVGTPLPKFGGTSASGNIIAPGTTPSAPSNAPARPAAPASTLQKKSGQSSLKIIK
ncbi:hypothetical protein [Burkholderia lata]|uniref:hypothetical protein n=1 Tax=Burkholderia lata (strain ATCC 17760 / DSM 23089 / LMG 22485 / NCIMB 9086 / R18194 / 383) TaxID=482957 RepID=UPI0012FD98BA|nr:hypothetical protein [Burkholderia lata]